MKKILALALAAALLACGPVKPPTPIPTPTPTPTPIPTPTPTPTPTPDPSCPAQVNKINTQLRVLARTIVDSTPLTGDQVWCAANGFPGRQFCPLGGEGSSQRAFCEKKLGPYSWAVNSLRCVIAGVDVPGTGCFMNGGNPLQVVISPPAPGLVIQVCADNVPFPQIVCGLVTLP